MTPPTPTQTVDDIRAGLEGVTPGEWFAEHDERGYTEWELTAVDKDRWLGCVVSEKDASHFARCSPARLLPVLDEFDRLRERIAALEKENEALRQDEACHDEELFSWEQDFAIEQGRAVKAEADLAEARKVITDCLTELDRSQRPSYAWQLRARAFLAKEK